MAFASRLLFSVLVSEMAGGFPNDPGYIKYQQHYFQAVQIPGAWELLQQDPNHKVTTIAIIDSGMKSDHPDLKDNAVVGYNVVDKNTDTHDREGHGTKMAGIAGAVINNGIGGAGTALSVRLMPIYNGGLPFNDHYIAEAIKYAVGAKADVILFAAGSNKPFDDEATAAITQAETANIPLICSAGNEGQEIGQGNHVFPCEYTKTIDGVICVAGTLEDTMNLFVKSNYASFIDAAAPATALMTTYDGGYVVNSRVSNSAAMVAGIVAMMKSVSPSALTVKQVKEAIKHTSDPGVKRSGGKVTMPFGRVNAYKAVKSM
ncbi:Suppressor of the cold-sensitive snRNP bioproteinsis mutant brr1-1 [Perkinsus olseni]|uniref:subtilisin n=1 Tax=Perkinsus olseni TaxID=32597 RepID=A0A7J6M7Z1_PEROL|nr:Suppressor of the cold-sensitive snRNP bioproteinsis mutant brr1-1 [Perkinsus olseni]